jgi:hypothetical protein
VTNATSPEAIYSLLRTAVDEGKPELVVRVGYWGLEGWASVESAVADLREEEGLTEEDTPWLVYYYPVDGPVGLLEFVLKPTQEQIEEMRAAEVLQEEEMLQQEETLQQEGELPPL